MYTKPIQTLILDTTSYCNLKCKMCPQSIENFDRTKGIMDFELIRKIIDELVETKQNVGAILPFWNGEPLMYPNFDKVLKYAAEKKVIGSGINSFNMHTNAQLLDSEKSELILETNLFSQILFSIDAYKKETYDKIRQGGNFDKIVENIKQFVKLRRKYQKKNKTLWPTLIFQFIVMGSNYKEAIEFHKFWSNFLKKQKIDFQVNYWWDKPTTITKDTILLKRCYEGDNTKQLLLENLHKQIAYKLGLITKKELQSNEKIFKTDEFRE